MFFDSHAHYDDKKFSKDAFETIKRAHKSGASYIVNVASNLESSIESISLSQHFDYIYATVGFHPHYVKEANSNSISNMFDLAQNEKVVAIGEIGLDYYHNISTPLLQRLWFTKQIDLAKELELPIIVHDREAHKDTLEILKSENAGVNGGILHCFSGSVEMAREVLKNNFYISIAGPITFKNVKKLVEVVSYVPMNKLLIETDSPYLTPEPNRGIRNDSSQLKYIAQKIAEIKNITIEEVAKITTENALKVYKIEKRKE